MGEQVRTGSSQLAALFCAEVGAIEAQIKEAKARKKRAASAVVGDLSQMLNSLPTFELLLDRATVQSRLNHRSGWLF